jgi:hypothetical protein
MSSDIDNLSLLRSAMSDVQNVSFAPFQIGSAATSAFPVLLTPALNYLPPNRRPRLMLPMVRARLLLLMVQVPPRGWTHHLDSLPTWPTSRQPSHP